MGPLSLQGLISGAVLGLIVGLVLAALLSLLIGKLIVPVAAYTICHVAISCGLVCAVCKDY